MRNDVKHIVQTIISCATGLWAFMYMGSCMMDARANKASMNPTVQAISDIRDICDSYYQTVEDRCFEVSLEVWERNK